MGGPGRGGVRAAWYASCVSDPLHIRPATREDLSLIIRYIRGLAAHEGRPELAVITPERLARALFDTPVIAEGFVLESDGRPIGYAIIQMQFSTFTGGLRVFLEDVYIDPSARSQGLGTRFMHWLFDLARERMCDAVDWGCVENNPRAMAFYERLGARQKTGVVRYRYELTPSRP